MLAGQKGQAILTVFEGENIALRAQNSTRCDGLVALN
jgi:hypothetical protein